MTALNAALLDAHARQDRAALVQLYQQAAAQVSGPERSFFLTQAYVFALESGHSDTRALRAALIDMGCERPA